MALVVAVEAPLLPDVEDLLAGHRAWAAQHSPPEDVHALDGAGLADPALTVVTAREDGALRGTGALRDLGDGTGELKAMHTLAAARGRGVGRAVLEHLLGLARTRGWQRVSLETGAGEAFAPSRALYGAAGFVACPPFAGYRPSPYSAFLTRTLP